MKEEKNNRSRPHLFAWIYGAALALYAVFVLLEAFVIPHGAVSIDTSGQPCDGAQASGEYVPKPPPAASSAGESGSPYGSGGASSVGGSSEAPLGGESGDAVSSGESEEPGESGGTPQTSEPVPDPEPETPPEPVVTATSYTDANISINITTRYEYDTCIYLADVVINDPALLKTGLAFNSFGKNITQYTSTIAANCGAIFAINGDYYGFRNSGYVMREGYLYRDKPAGSAQQDLVVYTDGGFEIISEGDVTAAELVERGAYQIFSFGPALIKEGEITVSSDSEVALSWVSNPRTAIGIVSPLHYILAVSDGRTEESRGLSLLELAEVMRSAGCVNAYNLDGGGSTAMWFMGRIVNKPTSNGDRICERSVSDIVYIGY